LKALSELQNESKERMECLPTKSNSVQTESNSTHEDDSIKGKHRPMEETKKSNQKRSPSKPSTSKKSLRSTQKQSSKINSFLIDDTVNGAKKETRKEVFLSGLEEVKRKKELEKRRQDMILLKRMDYLRIGNDILFEEPILV